MLVDDFIAGIAVVIAILLAVFLSLELIGMIAIAIEAVAVAGVALALCLWRIVLGRPWEVEAEHLTERGGVNRHHCWNGVGPRRAHGAIDQIANAITNGEPLAMLPGLGNHRFLPARWKE